MMKQSTNEQKQKLTRRNFFKFGGVVAAGAVTGFPNFRINQEKDDSAPRIKNYRTLGRTGFNASDISMGFTRVKEANIVRYAYDCGVNYFDNAEGYSNGLAEKLIGENMSHMDRKKIFITTKLGVDENESKERIKERFKKCLERLKTDYADALYMHGAATVAGLNHPGFFAATTELKAEGKLRFIGLSNHGPRSADGESMEKVLCAAAEDGRFDLMLLVYNFMNKEAGDKIIAACKKNNVGTTAMKTSPGILAVPELDPDNLTKEQQDYIERIIARGTSKETAIDRLKSRIERQNETYEDSRPFVEKYGIKTDDQLRKTSIQWVLSNPDMHTACISFNSFELVDMVIPLSNTKLSAADRKFLEEFKYVFNNQYCRHGCTACSSACPHGLPVSTIMRYAYYYKMQGNEKLAMQKYAKLSLANASACFSCDAPCSQACPFDVDIPSQMAMVHSMLTLV